MMMILPLRYTHIGRYFRVVAEYTLNSPTRGLKHRTTSNPDLLHCSAVVDPRWIA